MKLKIDEDYRSLLPELTKEEYTTLEKDIVKHGVVTPLLVWNGTIIDGHNRYSICQAHHIESFPTKEITFSSKDDAISWILVHQLGRRNLNDFQRNEIALKYQDVIAKRMKERQAEYHGNQYQKVDSGSNDHKSTTTRKELANIANTSEASIQRTKLILEKGTPEQIEQVRNGEVSIARMAKAINGDAEPSQIEKKICITCGNEYPADYFVKGRTQCKYCRNKAKRGSFRDVKGDIIKGNGTYDHVADEEIANHLYDDTRDFTVTIDDVVEEFLVNMKGYIENLKRILDIHKDLAESNKEAVKTMWSKAEEMLLSAKGDYV